jgi:hypothetical protein
MMIVTSPGFHADVSIVELAFSMIQADGYSAK